LPQNKRKFTKNTDFFTYNIDRIPFSKSKTMFLNKKTAERGLSAVII
jgi:hypothetical protein